MFLTSTIAYMIILTEFICGCLVGLLVAAILKRSTLTPRVATRAAWIAGLALLLAFCFVGWAGTSEIIEDGHTTAVGTEGEVLPFRTFVVNNGYLICGGASVVAAIAAVLLNSAPKTDKV